jgi:hypothetical protein
MNSKALKTSWIIVLIVNCVIIIIGLTLMIAPEAFMIGEYEGYTGNSWSDYTASNPAAASCHFSGAFTQLVFKSIHPDTANHLYP